MYCTNCGTKLSDDSLFCTECGMKMEKEQSFSNAIAAEQEKITQCTEENPEYSNVTEEHQNVAAPNSRKATQQKSGRYLAKNKSSQKMPKRKKNFKRGLVFWGAIIALVFLVVIIVFINVNTSDNGHTENIAMSAGIADDGTAYIPLGNGDLCTINDTVDEAFITADRRHIVVLLEDGLLYVIDVDTEERSNIAENVEYFACIRNDGFLYEDEDEILYRVLFSDNSVIKLGEGSATAADNTTAVLYAEKVDGDIKLYTLAADASQKVRIATSEQSVALHAISDDGQISVWTEKDGDVYTLVLHEGENKYILGEVSKYSDDTVVTFTADQNLLSVVNTEHDCMWIKSIGAEPIKIKLGADVKSEYPYSADGLLYNLNADVVRNIYVCTEGDSSLNLYHISMDGERERVLSKIQSFDIMNGYVVYLTEENSLCYAKLNGSDISEESKIANDVEMFQIAGNGQYVYYMKAFNNKTECGSLYCYKFKADDPVKISSDALCYYDKGLMCADVSADGETIYYYTDGEILDNVIHATLMMWDWRTGSTSRIATEVIPLTVTSMLNNVVNPDDFTFLKYDSVGDNDTVYLNWMHFDGEKATKFASNIVID